MEFLIKISDFVQSLEPKQFQKYVIVALGCAAVIIGSLIYYVHNHTASLIDKMKSIERAANKSAQLILDAQKLKEQEDHIQKILDKYQNFDIQGDFEQFCKEQNIVPEPGWASSVETINAKFNEEVLAATFKNQTTQKLVTYLEALEKKEIIYIKGLSVKNEKDKKISFDISIATKKRR
jgi:hypothetical protein